MREIASFAAYAVFIAAGAVALWSIARDLRRAWRASQAPCSCRICGGPVSPIDDGTCDDCWLMERPHGGL